MSNARKLWGLAFLLVLAVSAAACGGGSDEEGGSGGEAASGGTALTIELQDIKLVPSTLSAPAGEPFSLEVKNTGGIVHNLEITAGDQSFKTADLNGGESETLEIPALEAGDYEMVCAVPGHADAGMTGTLHVGGDSGSAHQDSGGMSGMTPEEMMEHDAANTASFVDGSGATEGTGNEVLKPNVQNGVKVFEIEAAPMTWEPRQGESVEVWAYNGQIPGPQIRVKQGDKVRVEFTNNLPEPSTIHHHGLTVPNAMDGVPGVTQDAVLPGDTFNYEFTVKNDPGTYMYHSHFNAAHQVDMGLLGTFIIEPRGKAPWDVEYTQVIGDGTMGYNLNGKSFPATAPMVAKEGQTVLVRLVNEGGQIHPMHSHGFKMTVINQDGHILETPYSIDTLDVSPGQRFDVLIEADQPGAWAFHCHILSHVESPDGMYGMVTALIVK